MNTKFQVARGFFVFLLAVFGLLGSQLAVAADDAALEKAARTALKSLYDGSAGAKALGEKAKGILVFPDVLKAGFVVGAQGGDGVLFVGGGRAGFYNTAAVSVGLQAGAQSFGYALFFMSDKELKNFLTSKNFQIGIGPSIVFIDEGFGKDTNSLTVKSDVYGVIFDQKGLMAGIGLKGSKITKLDR